MQWNRSVLLVVCGLAVNFGDAAAWDGERRGFILGAGGGAGVTHSSLSHDFFGSESFNDFAIGTDFRIGYAPTNQVSIFWMSKVSWVPDDIDSWQHGTGGMGIAYHFQASAPAPYIIGGIGFSSLGGLEGIDPAYGVGFAIGGGYELARHISAEGVMTWGNPDFPEIMVDTSLLSVVGVITFIGY